MTGAAPSREGHVHYQGNEHLTCPLPAASTIGLTQLGAKEGKRAPMTRSRANLAVMKLEPRGLSLQGPFLDLVFVTLFFSLNEAFQLIKL